MTSHTVCPNCDVPVVRCSECRTNFVVEPVAPGAEKVWPLEELARNAAVWHTYREHREVWISVVGDREPSDPEMARCVTS